MSTRRTSPDTLFDAPDYTSWCRALYRLPNGGPKPLQLFESTIAEPTEQLRSVIAATFDGRAPDRFESVFGAGNPYLVEALAARYRVSVEQVICTTGAANSITMTLRALIRAGDTVLIETPHLDLIEALPAGLGAQVSVIERDVVTYDIDADLFDKSLKASGARVVLLTNPHNPSGVWLGRECITELAAIAARAGATLIIDEVYADFRPGPRKHSAAALATNIVAVNSLTKVYGLFSLRCGWLITAPALARQVETANARLEFGPSKLAHAVAAHVFEHIEVFDDHWRGILAQTRPIVERCAAAMIADGLIEGALPESGCMYFPRLLDHQDTHAFARDLWERGRLLLAPGEFFGQPGHVRLGFGAADARLEEGLALLHAALLAHRQRATRTLRRKTADARKPS